MNLLASSRLGPYEILGPIGEGGMGVVYRARDPRLKDGLAEERSHIYSHPLYLALLRKLRFI